MKILLIKQTSLGDVIHSTLALEAIHHQWPEAEIHFMVDRGCYPVLQYNPHIKRFFFYEHRHFSKLMRLSKFNLCKVLKKIAVLMKEMRREQYDLAIDLQGIERSAIFLYAIRANKKFIKGRNKPLLKNFRNTDRNDHALTELCGTLALAGIDAENALPRIYLQPKAGEKLQKALNRQLQQVLRDDRRQLLLISPFTSWKTKDVPLSAWMRTIQLLARERPHRHFAFTAIPGQREVITRAIEQAVMEKSLKQRIYNLAGNTDIQQLISLIGAADLLMCSEGANAHIASALNTPVVAVFGPTQPSRVGPWGNKSRVVRNPAVQCLACYKRSCANRICMDNIEPFIAGAVEELLV